MCGSITDPMVALVAGKSGQIIPLSHCEQEDTMDISQELIEVYHLLRHQEEKLYELHKSLRATTEFLHKHGFGDEYARSYEAIGSSEVALDYAGTLRLIDETIRRLSESEDR